MIAKRKKQKYHLQVGTELTALQEVFQWFERLISPCIPQRVGWQCELALAEAFTNAVRHAHHDLPRSTPIDLEVELDCNSLQMKVFDCGQPFDLKAKLKANEANLTSVEKEGGRGLQLIEKLTDELQYLSLPDYRNCLVISKKYS